VGQSMSGHQNLRLRPIVKHPVGQFLERVEARAPHAGRDVEVGRARAKQHGGDLAVENFVRFLIFRVVCHQCERKCWHVDLDLILDIKRHAHQPANIDIATGPLKVRAFDVARTQHAHQQVLIVVITAARRLAHKRGHVLVERDGAQDARVDADGQGAVQREGAEAGLVGGLLQTKEELLFIGHNDLQFVLGQKVVAVVNINGGQHGA